MESVLYSDVTVLGKTRGRDWVRCPAIKITRSYSSMESVLYSDVTVLGKTRGRDWVRCPAMTPVYATDPDGIPQCESRAFVGQPCW